MNDNADVASDRPVVDDSFASPTVRAVLGEAWGALNFILAFYEPGQRYLDTEAWKHAEAGGRRVHAKLRAILDGDGGAKQPSTLVTDEDRKMNK